MAATGQNAAHAAHAEEMAAKLQKIQAAQKEMAAKAAERAAEEKMEALMKEAAEEVAKDRAAKRHARMERRLERIMAAVSMASEMAGEQKAAEVATPASVSSDTDDDSDDAENTDQADVTDDIGHQQKAQASEDAQRNSAQVGLPLEKVEMIEAKQEALIFEQMENDMEHLERVAKYGEGKVREQYHQMDLVNAMVDLGATMGQAHMALLDAETASEKAAQEAQADLKDEKMEAEELQNV